MALPFTVEQFQGVLHDDNTSMWPAQWIRVAMALAVVAAALRPRPWSGVAVSAILGALWAWMALAYDLAFFARIRACGQAARRTIISLIFPMASAGFSPLGQTSVQFRIVRHRKRR